MAKTRKRAASNVAETVITKRARKAKQLALPEDPELVEGDQGEEGESGKKENQGKGKPGKGGRGGKAVGKSRGKGGRYVPPGEPFISL